MAAVQLTGEAATGTHVSRPCWRWVRVRRASLFALGVPSIAVSPPLTATVEHFEMIADGIAQGLNALSRDADLLLAA